ncbi:hypothetical protein PV325_012838, partial [Microctonus aethiopoides]
MIAILAQRNTKLLFMRYHKPIVSVIEIVDDDAGNDDGEKVAEIMNETGDPAQQRTSSRK